MRFIQIIESESDPVTELTNVQGYAEMAKGDETVKVERVTICGDRDRPGVAVMIAEFASAAAARQHQVDLLLLVLSSLRTICGIPPP